MTKSGYTNLDGLSSCCDATLIYTTLLYTNEYDGYLKVLTVRPLEQGHLEKSYQIRTLLENKG